MAAIPTPSKSDVGMAAITDLLRCFFSAAAPSPAYELLLVGSHMLGTASDDESDLDVVLVVFGVSNPTSFRATFFKDFSEFLTTQHSDSSSNVAVATERVKVPLVSWVLQSGDAAAAPLHVDLALCLIPGHPQDLTVFRDWHTLEATSLVSIEGWRVGRLLWQAIQTSPLGKHATVNFIVWVKAWAKSHRIYRNYCGYLAGIAWTIMALYFLSTDTSLPGSGAGLDAVIPRFFAFYQHFDWRQPIALVDAKQSAAAEFQILLPLPPFENTTRGISRSGRWLIRHEIDAAGRAIAERAELGRDLLANAAAVLPPLPFHAQPFLQGFLLLAVGTITAAGLQQCQGWMKSQLVRLVQALEECSDKILVLPYPDLLPDENENYPCGFLTIIGIGRAKGTAALVEPKLEQFRETFERWIKVAFAPKGFGIHQQPATDAPGLKIQQRKSLPSKWRHL